MHIFIYHLQYQSEFNPNFCKFYLKVNSKLKLIFIKHLHHLNILYKLTHPKYHNAIINFTLKMRNLRQKKGLKNCPRLHSEQMAP